jgi:FAD dependent oxidoreductase TIGR03364
MSDTSYDCLIVGRGIVGLAHALAATRLGLRTAVLDRETRAIGASIRNFGFITVTGQHAGVTWRRALRARDIWADIAGPAGIAVHQRGLLMVARRPEALTVIEEFAAGPMGAGCRVLRGADLPPPLRRGHAGALRSPHELRVESRDAVPRLAAWLAEQGVSFLPRAAVIGVEPGRAHTPTGYVAADRIIVCPGPDLVSLFPQQHATRGITLSKLHMLRVAAPGWTLPNAVMSDLGLVRYAGYAGSPSLPALRARLAAEQGDSLADGIHLIAVQGADGSLVVGDSHHDADSPDPFQPRDIDDRILAELSAVLDIPSPDVVERWVGVYPSGPDTAFIAPVGAGVRLVNVTSGTGASTAFAIAEETLADLLGLPPPPHVSEHVT